MLFIPSSVAIFLIGATALLVIQSLAKLYARSHSRRDVESPASPLLKSTNEKSIPTPIPASLQDDTIPKQPPSEARQLRHYKNLYHKIQNLEHNTSILPEARRELINLLSSTLSTAQQDPSSGILSLPSTFSRSAVDVFLQADNDNTTDAFERYIVRRRAGQPREMFSDREEAKWWLKNAAPVKYVDGSWLGHINKTSTPFELRSITKDAWQVMSEELGDGDLAKNHVYVYEALMREIGCTDLPAGDDEDFIHPRHELNELRVWRAAVAQLLVSLFAHDFLPESLGFNMAYEGLPLHLMKTVEELRELKLNGYYFVLHISIDNADSGHSKMAAEAVCKYIDHIESTQGSEAAQKAWRRVQAGYILAEGLPTTPECASLKRPASEVFPRNPREAQVAAIFAAKAPVAHKLHCSSKLKIGRRSLVDWLEPAAFVDPQWQMDFLDDLAECSPWVRKGNSAGSKLVQELSWEGRMFGSFTEKEMEVLKSWIDGLPDGRAGVYCTFTGRSEDEALTSTLDDIRTDYPVFSTTITPTPDALLDQTPTPPTTSDTPIDPPALLKAPSENTSHHAHFGNTEAVTRLLPLWFASPSLLESFVTVPAKVSNTFGSAIVKLLRAQTGFAEEGDGVAGMDEVSRGEAGEVVGLLELGLRMRERAVAAAGGADDVKGIKDVIEQAEAAGAAVQVEAAEMMLHASMRPMQYRDVLVGMTAAFVALHEQLVEQSEDLAVLASEDRVVLKEIARRERLCLDICEEEIEKDGNGETRSRDYRRGRRVAKGWIEACRQ